MEVADQDPVTDGTQISHYGAPPAGGCYFFQVTASAGACGTEGPR